jgi:hypothetical protein
MRPTAFTMTVFVLVLALATVGVTAILSTLQ